MYSRDEIKKDYINVLDLEINGKKLEHPIYLSHKHVIYSYALNKYSTIVENNNLDPSNSFYDKPFNKLGISTPKFIEEELVNDSNTIAQFPVWIKKYLSQNYNVEIKTLKIDLIKANYDNNNKLIILNKTNLINE